MRTRRIIAVVVTAATLALGTACGDGGDDKKSSGNGSPAPSAASPASSPSPTAKSVLDKAVKDLNA